MSAERDHRLVDYLYDELSPEEAAAYRRALDADPDEARELESLDAMLGELRTIEEETPPAHLDALVLAHARQAADEAAKADEKRGLRGLVRRILGSPFAGIALAGGVAALAAIVLVPTVSRQYAPEPQSIPMPASVAPDPAPEGLAPADPAQEELAREGAAKERAEPKARAKLERAEPVGAAASGAGASDRSKLDEGLAKQGASAEEKRKLPARLDDLAAKGEADEDRGLAPSEPSSETRARGAKKATSAELFGGVAGGSSATGDSVGGPAGSAGAVPSTVVQGTDRDLSEDKAVASKPAPRAPRTPAEEPRPVEVADDAKATARTAPERAQAPAKTELELEADSASMPAADERPAERRAAATPEAQTVTKDQAAPNDDAAALMERARAIIRAAESALAQGDRVSARRTLVSGLTRTRGTPGHGAVALRLAELDRDEGRLRDALGFARIAATTRGFERRLAAIDVAIALARRLDDRAELEWATAERARILAGR